MSSTSLSRNPSDILQIEWSPANVTLTLIAINFISERNVSTLPTTIAGDMKDSMDSKDSMDHFSPSHQTKQTKSASCLTHLTSRREFLKFMGATGASATLGSLLPALSACTGPARSKDPRTSGSFLFEPLAPTASDHLNVAPGFRAQVFLKWGDSLNAVGDTFGTNNDFLAFFRLNPEGSSGILWVNHESLQPLFVSGASRGQPRTRAQIVREQMSIGGSLVHVRRDARSGQWSLVANDPLNRRITARTSIPLVGERPIAGSRIATGTLANCAGGITPWGTVLTCEENYDDFYGETVHEANGTSHHRESALGWEHFFDYPPEHYGWVVEVHPLTGAAKKLTALGRFAHECATVRVAADGRCVVYSGDDENDRCLYKFIASRPGSLESGTLHVANFAKGRWLPLDLKVQTALQRTFKDQTELLIRCREAAELLGGTPLDRPEDIEIDPASGAVYVALTNNIPRGNPYGSVLKLEEKNNDPLALEFQSSVFVAGGPETGFACPDNLVFDRRGNLWMTSDISGSQINKSPYAEFGHNSLYYIPLSGSQAGQALRVASAPTDAELTGPTFSPDGRTLFLSVQHPGERSTSLGDLTSHWPDGGGSIPRSAVVAITGPALDRLLAGDGLPPVVETPVLSRTASTKRSHTLPSQRRC